MAILFICAFIIFAGWYLLINDDEQEEQEEQEEPKKATDFLKSTGIGIKFTVDDVKQTFKED